MQINKIENEKDELKVEEVNVYIADCGDLKYHCMTDCPFKLPFISKNY